MSRRICGIALVAVLAAAIPVRGQDWDRAISLFNQKQYRSAIAQFHTVLRANPDYWQAWYYIGYGHFQLKEYEDSTDSFDRYIKGAGGHDKEQAAGYYFVGFSRYEMKQYDRAVQAFSQYVSLMERLRQTVDPTALAAEGRSYIFSAHYAEAIPPLTRAAAEMKNNSNNYYYVGFAEQKLGHEDRAISALNQGLGIDPKDADTLALLANIYLGRVRQDPGAARLAVATGERLISVRNDDASAALLGQAYLLDKQYSKAAPLLGQYARAHSDSGPALFNYGLALSRSGQWKPAAQAIEQSLKLVPGNRAAMLELGYVYESDKQYDKALDIYQRAYAASGNKDEIARGGIDRVKQIMASPSSGTALPSNTTNKSTPPGTSVAPGTKPAKPPEL
ncbi:MAG TPA: tetratricopeptide repeat protein [Blastocatellia bacterium]|nr:tetratricopeptide repeat protein [Blastocatellia bacterium]